MRRGEGGSPALSVQAKRGKRLWNAIVKDIRITFLREYIMCVYSIMRLEQLGTVIFIHRVKPEVRHVGWGLFLAAD